MRVPVVENVLKLNDEIAALNRQSFAHAGVFVVDVMGAPGCGKTALIEKTIQAIGDDLRIGVIVGDLATQRDADRMARFAEQVVQVNTGKTCHLEANHIHRALDRIELDLIDLLFIENVGNLICPVGFDLGQSAKVGVFSATEGDDKAAKHPYIVRESNLLILNKVDLIEHVPFDLPLFRNDVQVLAKETPLLELSARTGQNLQPWLDWLTRHVAKTTPETLAT